MCQYSSGTKASIWASRFAHEFQRHRLNPAGAETPSNLVPQKGAELVAHQPVEYATSLLSVDHPLVDLPGLVECGQDRRPGNLVEREPADRALLGPQLPGQVPPDRLTLAVRVGRDVNVIDALGGVPELLDDLLASRNHVVYGREAPVDVDAKFALRQVSDVPH